MTSQLILSDRLFIVDIETSATLQNSVVSSNIFSYVYNYRGNVSKSQGRIKCDANIGISHGDDTIYILSTAFNTRSTPSDAKMGNILIDLTTSFMKFGKPNITTFWEPFSKQLRGFYQLRILGPDNFEMERNVQIGQSNFWRQLLFEENNNLKAQFKEEL